MCKLPGPVTATGLQVGSIDDGHYSLTPSPSHTYITTPPRLRPRTEKVSPLAVDRESRKRNSLVKRVFIE